MESWHGRRSTTLIANCTMELLPDADLFTPIFKRWLLVPHHSTVEEKESTHACT